MDPGFIRRDIEMKVLLIDLSEDARMGTKRRPGPLTSVAVYLLPAISVIIPRPLASGMAHSGIGRMAPPITLPLISIEPRAASGDVFREQAVQVRVSA
jgi:hypothetical protein